MSEAGNNQVNKNSNNTLLALYPKGLSTDEVFGLKSNLIGFFQVLSDMDKQVQISKECSNEKTIKKASKKSI